VVGGALCSKGATAPRKDISMRSTVPPTTIAVPLCLRRESSARVRELLAHARRAAAGILRRPPNDPDVEDRAQDAVVALLASGRFDARLGTPEAYLGTIARRLSLSYRRDRATRTRLEGRLAEERTSTASCAHRRVEARRDLRVVLSRLCDGHAEALLAIDLAGEPIAEAAARLGKSYEAMNGQVGHARAAARRVARQLSAA
jgi:DNA-directed RNA polymerase specialized sigma24 family protein